jgi:hypothetical protein
MARGRPSVLLCGDKGDRTPDLVNAIHALSQLSYIPEGTDIYRRLRFLSSAHPEGGVRGGLSGYCGEMQQHICTECARRVTAVTQVNFMGFPKFMCPLCQKTSTQPLASWRFAIYAVIAGLGVLGSISFAMSSGGIPIMGIIPALMLAAIIMDFSVQSRFRAAKKRYEASPNDEQKK